MNGMSVICRSSFHFIFDKEYSKTPALMSILNLFRDVLFVF